MLLYHGGTLLAKATDHTQSHTKTLLGVMISCMLGGPTFFSKMLPTAKLNLHFFMKTYKDAINQSSGGVKSVTWDDNRNKQVFFIFWYKKQLE